jgi:hypothetical protein
MIIDGWRGQWPEMGGAANGRFGFAESDSRAAASEGYRRTPKRSADSAYNEE